MSAEALVDGRVEDDPYFRDHILAFGYRHEVQVPCVSLDTGRAFLCFTRKEAAGSFDDRHLALLDAIAPTSRRRPTRPRCDGGSAGATTKGSA